MAADRPFSTGETDPPLLSSAAIAFALMPAGREHVQEQRTPLQVQLRPKLRVGPQARPGTWASSQQGRNSCAAHVPAVSAPHLAFAIPVSMHACPGFCGGRVPSESPCTALPPVRSIPMQTPHWQPSLPLPCPGMFPFTRIKFERNLLLTLSGNSVMPRKGSSRALLRLHFGDFKGRQMARNMSTNRTFRASRRRKWP